MRHFREIILGRYLVEVPVERTPVRRALSSRRRGYEIYEVRTGCAFNACARIRIAGVTVAVVNEQNRVAEPRRRTDGIGERCIRIEPRTDNKNPVLGERIPRTGIAVGAAHAPRGARRP